VKEDTNGHEHKQKEPGRYRKIQNIGRSREDKESSGIGDTESSSDENYREIRGRYKEVRGRYIKRRY
jgi:hypothetical protein